MIKTNILRIETSKLQLLVIKTHVTLTSRTIIPFFTLKFISVWDVSHYRVITLSYAVDKEVTLVVCEQIVKKRCWVVLWNLRYQSQYVNVKIIECSEK